MLRRLAITPAKRQNERGSAELVSFIFVIPLLAWLIFSLIDISLYMNARSEISNVARDAARQVAIYGGNDNPLLNPYKSGTIAANIKKSLYSGGKCTASGCKKAPTVKCTPAVTKKPGEMVQCSITYHYKSALGGNPIAGFADFLGSSFTVQETARSEAGF